MPLMFSFKELYRALMAFGGGERVESSEVSTLMRRRIAFARIQTISA